MMIYTVSFISLLLGMLVAYVLGPATEEKDHVLPLLSLFLLIIPFVFELMNVPFGG